MTVHSTVIQSIARTAGVDAETLSPQATLRDLGIASLDALELIFELEEHFDLQLKEEEIDLGTATIARLVAVLESALARKAQDAGALAAT